MLKYWRVLILIVCVLGAVLAIGMKYYPYGRTGIEIVYVSGESPAADILQQGMYITQVNGKEVKNLKEWEILQLKGPTSLKVNGKTYNFFVNNSIGIDVMDISRTNMEFGLDIRGGTRILLKLAGENTTKETIDQVIATLQSRANAFGLKEMSFRPIISGKDYYVQIEAVGIGRDIVDDLLSKVGKFEAKITKPVEITGDIANIKLNEKTFPVKILENNTIEVNNKKIKLNDSFEIDQINFQFIEITDRDILLLADVYKGDDIELVYTDSRRSAVQPSGNGFRFYFVVLVSQDGAGRFGKVTSNIPKQMDIQSGGKYLKDSRILLYLDDKLITDLKISADLGGKPYQTPQIEGFREKKEDAIQEKLQLQTILRSGAIPVKIETASVDVISPRLGSDFIQSALYAGLFAGLAVFVIVFVRYRKIKISLPLIFIALSEIIIILGIAATNDSSIWGAVLLINIIIILVSWWKKHEVDTIAWIGAILVPVIGMGTTFTIDLPVIGGIIAAIGTSVDHQIIIADETGRKKGMILALKEKIKRAFFIIFGAAATTIFAMLPLMFLVAGFVRGFAVTVIIGVLVGILITRPAYAKIIEMTTKEDV